LSTIDVILWIFIGFGLISGWKEGFLMGLISLFSIVLGIFAGFKLMGMAMGFLDRQFNIDETVLPYVAFLAVYIIVVILVRLIGKAVKGSIDQSFLGRMDSVLGSLLGAVKVAFGLAVFLWITDSLSLRPPYAWTEDSWLYPGLLELPSIIAGYLGEVLPFFRETFDPPVNA
jgi:membrane protein required for colicin V production